MVSVSDSDLTDVEAALAGYPSIDKVDRRLLLGVAIDVMGVDGLAGDRLVDEYFDLFTRNKKMRIIKELADQAGIPFSVALERWADPADVAAEIAHRAVKAVESWKKCPRCGVDPDDMKRNGRWLEFGRWKFGYRRCDCCRILKSLNDGEEDDGQWSMLPRRPGDPLQDGPMPD